MPQYTSKFGTGDTAYLVDTNAVTITPVTVSDVFIKQSLYSGSTVYVMYKIRTPEKFGVGKEINESDLYTLAEAKNIITPELLQKQSDIQSLT